jgi:CPA1 family monovalent cation:H+ antiporter
VERKSRTFCFEAAFATSWRDFRYNLVSITFLAFGLVGFTVFGVALISQWILPGFDWRLGLVLGAVVSTTDAIAATSIGRRIGLPQRMIDVLEGESLINDASGLLALEFTVALVVTGQTPGVLEGGGRLLFLVVGGVAVGLILGKLVDWVERRIDDAPIEITISLVTPYVAYLGAESIHSSGVLAAVACGLYLGRRSATYFSSTVRIEAWAFWNTLTFVLNGIVFILIGLQLPYILGRIQHLSLGELLLRGALFSAVVILLRMIWMYPGAYFSYLIRRRLLGQPEPTPPARTVFIAGWAGMRGVVALAAAAHGVTVVIGTALIILGLSFSYTYQGINKGMQAFGKAAAYPAVSNIVQLVPVVVSGLWFPKYVLVVAMASYGLSYFVTMIPFERIKPVLGWRMPKFP